MPRRIERCWNCGDPGTHYIRRLCPQCGDIKWWVMCKKHGTYYTERYARPEIANRSERCRNKACKAEILHKDFWAAFGSVMP